MPGQRQPPPAPRPHHTRRAPLHDDLRQLATLSFDTPEPLTFLTIDTVQDVLARHTRGLITDADLELWADALEARDDVALDPAIRACLFEPSTPELTDKTIAGLADEWRARLAAAPAD